MKVKGMALMLCAVIPAVAASNAFAGTVDLTTSASDGTINSALYEQGETGESAGTGTFISFLRIQKDGSEEGYNHDYKQARYDEKPSFTSNLLLGDIPVVTVGGVKYAEFWLDINENNGSQGGEGVDKYLSLDKLQLRISSTILEGDGAAPDYDAGVGTLIYDMDGSPDGDSTVLLNFDLEAGSGQADMRLLVPVLNFLAVDGINANWGLYLYSAFGSLDQDGYDSSDGIEEWAIRGATAGTPRVTLFDTPVVPLPSSVWMGLVGFAGLGYMQFRRRRQNQALDV